MTVNLKAVIDGMDTQNETRHTFLNRRTGELVTIGDEDITLVESDIPMENIPAEQHDAIRLTRRVLGSNDFIQLPSKYDIHEYSIMERFCLSREDEELREKLLFSIHGQGAFRRFKETVQQLGAADDWQKFRQAVFSEIAVEWLKTNRIRYTTTTS